ncbi:S-layer homology domain-containing protein [Sporosarcina sp. FA9]|uniref:S-layer homology domain-containing protein n=1 Tax=Sporosarcina sp. FA9 TaxID=3413030 RepID=UPI003F65FB70
MNQLIKKIIPTLLVLVLMLPILASANAKDDITGHHHEKELRLIIDKKIMNGYGNGIYKPDGQVTRGQFAVIMTRALNLEVPHEGVVFSDVTEETGVVEGVLAAAGANLITGYPDGTFKPTAKISRQHMAVIVKRALDHMAMEDKTTPLTFTDNNKILEEYHSAISNTVNYKIFNGSKMQDGVYFRPLDNATRGDAAAVISRFLTAVGKVEEEIPPVEPEIPDVPEIPVLTYDTASIQENGSTIVSKSYKTYEQALAALKSGDVIQYGDSIIKMPGGIVVTKPTLASSLTHIYPTKSLTNVETYVTTDIELEYVSSTDTYVEIAIAGKKGFIKHENSNLKPWKAVKERSYYSVSKDVLTHHIYLNSTGKYVSYQAGKAPSTMKAGERYYSWDGINFKSANGVNIGAHYQYFQYLPARSASQYTAEEIDAYTIKLLETLKKDNPNNEIYTDAVEKSKLVGLGSYLKKVEEEKNVNAMLILALAQHESAYGLSANSQEFNNLFGLKIYDDRPASDHFVSVEENIDELLKSYFNKNYIPPNAPHANGAVFGNKAMGFNVKYASDPYWGAKAAGHMYRMDKMMGGRELSNPYKVGLTTEALNVRFAPNTDIQRAFRYDKTGLPVLILESAEISPWLKIASDSLEYSELFVHGDYVREIPTVK